ncbi:uncharacterized protein LOC108469461 [Gossypium arboreum]|uniref:RING-type domain-containing protein n=1 Tax=Gossypium arboreum TaxID=29729 RepID=A0ABR0P565_GOSAR|nr:uncharacterized protein LOC108469461 [Gossypium arboreum]XP_052887543.1 uncharacterized protein LOC108469461 [Gossypium arboreum]KAK5813464.1 hypothetical protein PVK06_028914 [Gossypium arboreum]
MSAVDSSLAGLTLDDVLGHAKRSEPPSSHNHTPLETVRDDPANKDKKSWKLFREKLKLRKTGSGWTSSISIPASDVNIQAKKPQNPRRVSFAETNRIAEIGDRAPVRNPKAAQLGRRSSVRYAQDHQDPVDAVMPNDGPPSRSFKPQNIHNDDDGSPGSSPKGAQRILSAREAVASQEAAEAAAAAAAAEAAEKYDSSVTEEPVTMSLMDLLGESGSSYIGEDDEDEYDEDEEDEEEEIVQAKGIEFTCCICKVNLTSSVFMPCGHTYCRLCSKELLVQRGNCPHCNGFVLEVLEIF